MNNNEEPDNDDIVLFSSGLQETKDGKLITTTEHLYEQMLVFNQKLEELADNELPRMIKNTKREAIKKDLSEWLPAFFKNVAANVSLVGSKNVDLLEGFEEPFDESLERKKKDLEQQFNSLLEKRIHARRNIYDQVNLILQHASNNVSHTEDTTATTQSSPQLSEDPYLDSAEWDELKAEIGGMMTHLTSLSGNIESLIKEYEQVESIIK
ncbi:uncharacterized protein RHIMIDRAFT_247816 [Rhizopus microsporus ATCC 52813]|uniref:Uncharacterized protein n=1 Tax=Rhizopus microsporus ATCC 52813 TaxID=1340429 RepID=A0A2G4SI36_RHIZD|nr:uncharacterized protein RHIMIDRAFT_247816 [Rhizopus microsporus ATCC 52813]PHZ08409.1 hypothetical protein RHIMIDRAFT_247816 [Rhizopus microsporus ATCC 52813]